MTRLIVTGSLVVAFLLGALAQSMTDHDAHDAHRIGDPWHPVRATAGDCTGFAVPAVIVHRESGDNPSAYNQTADTYGCAQVALDLYHPGRRCQGLSPFEIDGQRTCVARLVRKFGLTPWPPIVRP